MKKAFKIIGISLASLVGLVLIAAIVALSTVTSPKQLTKLVKKYLPELVPYDIQVDRAKLTIVKTFPDIGLELDEVALLSPMENSPTDTLAKVEKLTLSADAKQYLKNKQILVKRCLLENSDITLFTDEEGRSNLDIFKTQDDDTTTKPIDLQLDLREVSLKNTKLSYIDLRSKLFAATAGLDINLKGTMNHDDIDALLSLQSDTLTLRNEGLQGALSNLEVAFDGRFDDLNSLDGSLTLACPDLCLHAGYDVLNHDKVKVELPLTLALDTLSGTLHDAQLALNDLLVSIPRGTFRKDDPDLALDADFHTNTLDIETVMAFLPEKVVNNLKGIRFTGQLELSDGRVFGVFNDSLMPVITTDVTARNAEITIPQLPYPFTGTELSTHLSVNLNDSINANDLVLSTKMNNTRLEAKGDVTDLARKLALDLDLNGNMPLADLKPFLPKQLKLKGKADVKLKTKGTLDDLMEVVTKYRFRNKLLADAQVTLRDLSFDMDSLHAAAPKLVVSLDLPASRRIKGRTGAYLALSGDALSFQQGRNLNADLQTLELTGTADQLDKGLEAMLANADLSLKHLDLVYDTIRVAADQPMVTVETNPGKRQGLHLNTTFKTGSLDAIAGSDYHLNAQAIAVTATANQDKAKDPSKALLHWNPTADFVLTNATLDIPQLKETIRIPTIDFLADTREIGFRKGGVKVGKSDLTLTGNVIGIDQWLENPEKLLKAELQVSSNYLDINEIMDLTSGLGASADSTATAEVTSKEDNPFMVPQGIDFTLGIHSKKALFKNLELNNLGGTATIKDGTLLLQEIGFTNEAAEMQLTALYQSPRKNHLFLGLDFHLLNVQIHDLLHIIPEIDTIVPMLKTFDGAAEFHIAAQTNLKSNYDLKMSTLRASADIEGANLSVRDIASFTKITDMLKVSTNGEYRIDSIDIQMTVFRDEVDLWPFQISLGKYKATLDGHYNLNTIGEYHISVTESPLPTRLGLKISGPLNNLSYNLESCKYPNLYKPNKRNDTEQLVMQLKQQIAAKLKENVQ